jgi:uncharacterized protein
MPVKISINVNGALTLAAELNDSVTARKIAAALPIQCSMARWGDEYYGSCGVRAGLEDGSRTKMAVGEIAFWPPGNALCFFFGPTPASDGPEPTAASEVNPVGMIADDPIALGPFGSTIMVRIERTPATTPG